MIFLNIRNVIYRASFPTLEISESNSQTTSYMRNSKLIKLNNRSWIDFKYYSEINFNRKEH